MSVSPATGKAKIEEFKLEASLGYIVRACGQGKILKYFQTSKS